MTRIDTRPRRQHRASVAHVVIDGYRRCALEICGKILPDDASDKQKYCTTKCGWRAQAERNKARQNA